MNVNGIMTNAQGSDVNFQTSVSQYLQTVVKPAYDTAALAASIDQGTQVLLDGTLSKDTFGLKVIDALIDDPDTMKRAPLVAFRINDSEAVKESEPTGMGDGSNWEWCSISLTCVPAVTVTNDASGQPVLNPNAMSAYLLNTAVRNAFSRTLTLPIVDRTQTPTNNVYPQVSFAYIIGAKPTKRPVWKDGLVNDRRDFEWKFSLRYAVQTADGL
jgi:hypothetical protein